MQAVGFWMSKRSQMHPERIALTVPGGGGYVHVTYAQLNRRVNRLARALRSAGLSRGDRVAILSLNCPEFVELLFAAAKAGLIVVPLNVRLAVPEWRYQLADSGARLLLVGPEFAAHGPVLQQETTVERVIVLPAPGETGEYGAWLAAHSDDEPVLPAGEPPVTLDERFIICYTSGTTGKPKGAVLTQGNQFANALNSCMTLDISGRDTTITLLPMFHVGGIGLFTLPTLYAGGRVVLPRRFDPGEALRLIETERVTIVFGVPTIHRALLQHPDFDKTDFRSVRYFYSGGAPCPVDLIRAFHSRGLAFGQGYGLTETSPTHFLLVPEDFERKAGSIGRPALHAEARIVDANGQDLPPGQVGEVVVRGPNVFKEYWGKPQETAAAFRDGWFRTGDLGWADEEGCVTLVGRLKEMIISGGENIYPVEVEQVLESHPDIVEAAVVGLPDPHWGETPHAAIVLRPGANLDSAALSAWCRQRLAGYKVPKSFTVVEALPRNAAGKVEKPKLVTMLSEQLGAEQRPSA